MANKYWETEKPVILQTEKNEIRFFKDNGKIQVYPRLANTANGVGKGATIDLETFTATEMEHFLEGVRTAINVEIAKKVEGEANAN